MLLAAAVTVSVALTGARPETAVAAPAPAVWCGVPAAVDQPDAASAFQIHVVYAYPSDGADRFSERLLPILGDLAAVDAWWQGQDPGRTLRLDLLSVACDTALGRLDVTEVRLPRDGAYYAAAGTTFERLTSDLRQPPLGFSSPDKKYLVYYDGALQSHHVCGTSPLGPSRASGISIVYLDSLCGGDLGAAGEAAATAAHELLHNLAARQRLHGCSGTISHACDDSSDILYWAVESGALLANLHLDVGRDDYYGLGASAGTWWDVRNSVFLEHLDSPSTGGPTEPAGFSATSAGTGVTLSWPAATGTAGPVYRLYRGGALVAEVATLGAADRAPLGATVVYTLRAASAGGYLSAPQTIRFRVGVGIVDDSGTLLRDTVPPPQVSGLRLTRAGTTVALRWHAVTDAGGIAGYRVFRGGRSVGPLLGRLSLTIARGRAAGIWTVAAVDRAGNRGPVSKPLRCS